MDLAIVLVNYGGARDTIDCIYSLKESDYQSIEIILVDNGSTDDSVDILTREFPNQKIIRIQDNILFAGGYNAGIFEALKTGASHIFVLNNDTILDKSALSNLMRAPVDIMVPKICYYDRPELVWAAGARFRRFPPGVVMIGFQKLDGPTYNQAKQIEYGTGCAFIAKREVFEKAGMFDQDFGCYYEDYDFFYRVKEEGFSVGYIPDARILHKVSRTLGKTPPFQRRYIARNTVLFFRKNDRFPGWMMWTGIGWTVLREALKGNFAEIPDYWRGFREGLTVSRKLNKNR